MKKTIFIAIAISVYMTLSVVMNHVANRHTVVTADVTLDLIDVMTLAFDEGGEGGSGLPAPGKCANFPTSNPYWLSGFYPDLDQVYDDIVLTTCGLTFFAAKLPLGLEIESTIGTGNIGVCRVCKDTWKWWVYCCSLDIECYYHWGGGGEAH